MSAPPAGPPDLGSLPPAVLEQIAAASMSADKALSFIPVLLGGILAAFLYGMSVVKFFDWVGSTSKDRLYNRLTTYWVFSISTVLMVYTIYDIMHLFAYNYGTYGQFLGLKYHRWFALMDVLIITAVQAFFAERAYRVSHNNKFFLVFISALVIGYFACGLGFAIAFHSINNVLQMEELKYWIYTLECFSAAGDLVNTGMLAYGLLSSRTGWSATDRMITKVVRTCVQAQLLPTLGAISTLVQYSIAPSSAVGMFHQLVLVYISLVSFMLVLNSRDSFKRGQAGDNTFNNGSDQPSQATVFVDTETYAKSYEVEQRKLGLNRSYGDVEKAETASASGSNPDLHSQTSRAHLRPTGDV